MAKVNSIKLKEPLVYRGKNFEEINLSGNPFFEQSKTAMGRVKKEYFADYANGQSVLHSEIPETKLNDLKSEVAAYSYRSGYIMDNIRSDQHPVRVLKDVDQMAKITNLIHNNTKDNQLKDQTHSAMNVVELGTGSVLVHCALHEKNYEYAKLLLENIYNHISDLDANHSGYPNIYGVLYPLYFGLQALTFNTPYHHETDDREVNKDMLKDNAERALKRVESDAREFNMPENNIIPHPDSAHPYSLSMQLETSEQFQEYSQADRVLDRIIKLQARLYSKGGLTALESIGNTLMTSVLPAGYDFSLDGDKLYIYENQPNQSSNKNILTVHDRGNGSISFSLKDTSLQPDILGLIHSHNYCLRFERAETFLNAVDNQSRNGYLFSAISGNPVYQLGF